MPPTPAFTLTIQPTIPTPTSLPIISPTATIPAVPTSTAAPTNTVTITPTSTLIPTVSADREDAPVETPLPPIEADVSEEAGVDRSCVEPQPEYYARDRVGDTVWPTPMPRPLSHFTLEPALTVGGDMQINKTFPYGYDGGLGNGLHLHVGMDVFGAEGVPLLAPADGTIVFARSDKEEMHGLRCNWYGQFVTIRHDEWWRGQPVYTLYGHVLNITVTEGQTVKRGDQVAEIGFGGAAYVAHLHIETRVGENTFGSTRNPLLWYEPPQGQGIVAGRLLNGEGKPWLGIPVYAVPAGENLGSPPTRKTWSYLGDTADLARPDIDYAENFVFGNLPAGEYTIMANITGEWLSQTVRVIKGRVVTVEIKTEISTE